MLPSKERHHIPPSHRSITISKQLEIFSCYCFYVKSAKKPWWPAMDGPRQHLDCLHFQKLWHACSFKRCCLFLVIFLLFIVLTLGVATILVIFILKPQKPVFTFQTISLDWYNLDTYSDSFLFVSSVITLTLNAQNPNKFGLRYGSTRLGLYFEGLPIGVIRVPGFIQPAHSNNVSVPTRVLFDCVNVSQIVDGASLHDGPRKDMIQMNILGDVRAQLLVHHMAFLKIKVCNASHFIKTKLYSFGHFIFFTFILS